MRKSAKLTFVICRTCFGISDYMLLTTDMALRGATRMANDIWKKQRVFRALKERGMSRVHRRSEAQ